MIRYILMRFPEGKKKALTLSYDDCTVADRKMVEILNRYGIRATFNLNSDFLNREGMLSSDEAVSLFRGHEIAIHGACHRAPGRVTPLDHIDDVLRDRRALEALTGEIVRGYAYPDTGIRDLRHGANYSDIRRRLVDLGVTYARSLGGDNSLFELPNDFLAWMPTAHHQNEKLFDYLDEFLAFDGTRPYAIQNDARLFYLWGHAYEFDECHNNNWERLEKFCKKAAGHDDVWYATNIEIADYTNAYRALVYSVDKTRVYNPTAHDVWLETAIEKKLYYIPAGKTVALE